MEMYQMLCDWLQNEAVISGVDLRDDSHVKCSWSFLLFLTHLLSVDIELFEVPLQLSVLIQNCESSFIAEWHDAVI